jgi:hypothetical protein
LPFHRLGRGQQPLPHQRRLAAALRGRAPGVQRGKPRDQIANPAILPPHSRQLRSHVGLLAAAPMK